MSRSSAACHPDRALRAHGRCNACYLRAKRSGGLTLRARGSRITPRRPWKHRMADCHPERAHFAKGQCRTCYGRDNMRLQRARGRVEVYSYHESRKRGLMTLYGLTLEDYDAMLAAQGGVCAACGRPPVEGRVLEVDHNHETGQVRGLLCRRCNLAIAYIEDGLAEAWQAYLARSA